MENTDNYMMAPAAMDVVAQDSPRPYVMHDYHYCIPHPNKAMNCNTMMAVEVNTVEVCDDHCYNWRK